MSPASKSKSKDKKAGKETQKASSKASGSATGGTGVPANAYNPLLGTFHSLDMAPTSINSPLHNNGRFRNIEERDEHGTASVGAGAEYDSVSNNDSWSGESEDHKEKFSNHPIRLEPVPGADNDKREKIRQKNEKKHQRQKERRAQELHEKSNGYLMSRKLEALAQQLVAMGFSHERATMALILNEGRVEESVAWLFEGGEDADKYKDQNLSGGNLKIDISEELARVAEMEIRFKCSKQEVERAIVSCEGDLETAAETLRAQKQEPVSAPSKSEETGDPPTISNGKLAVSADQSSAKLQPRTSPSIVIKQRKEDKDFNYAKTAEIGGPVESGSRTVESLKRVQPNLEWPKPMQQQQQQQTGISADKRWQIAGSNPSVPFSLTSQVSPPPAKLETRSETKNIQSGLVRDPVVMMQRPQSSNTKQVHAASISSPLPATASGWYPTTSVEMMKSSGLPHLSSSRSFGQNDLSYNPLYNQVNHQQQHYFTGSNPGDFVGSSRGVGSRSRTAASPTLPVASSLGLFSRVGSTNSSGASEPVDWKSGAAAQFDYTNIDWSLDNRGLSSPNPGMLLGVAPIVRNSDIHDMNASILARRASGRLPPYNGHGGHFAGLQDGGAASGEAPSAGSQEWTSQFEEHDRFSPSRQFMYPPSL